MKRSHESLEPCFMVPEQSRPDRIVGDSTRDRHRQVDAGQGTLLGHEAHVGLDQICHGVGAAMLRIGIDRSDRLTNDCEDHLFLRIEEVVEAPGADVRRLADRLHRGGIEPPVGKQGPGGGDDSFCGLDSRSVPHRGNASCEL